MDDPPVETPDAAPTTPTAAPSLSLASAAMLADLERRYVALRQEKTALQEQLSRATAAAAVPLPATVPAAERPPEWRVLEEEKRFAEERAQRGQVEADALREELQRVTDANTALSTQMAQRELQSAVASAADPGPREMARLQTECDRIQAHAAWLEQELAAQQRDTQHLRQETGDRVLQLQLQLDRTRQELEGEVAKAQVQQKLERDLQRRLSAAMQDQLELKLQLQQEQEEAAQQLAQERRVVELQEEHLARWQNRYDDVVRENERLQRTAEQALQASDQELRGAQEQLEAKYVAVLQEQKAAYETKLARLQERADLVAPRHLLTAEVAPEHPSPPPEEEEGPMNMTDLYEKLETCQAQLRAEVLQRKKWQLQFQRVQQDIAAKTPEMSRQRQEYELALAQLHDYQSRLTALLQERDDAIADRRDATQELQVVEHRLAERTAEVQTLAQQVQALLVSRAGGTPTGEIPTSVVEMQQQNQRLLGEHRRLTQQVAEWEERLRTDDTPATVAAMEREMQALRQERKEQELLVGRIVQQRDLYRALLCKHDSAILGETSSPEEVTALTMAQQQSDRIKTLEQNNLELEGTVKRLQSEADKVVREKEGMEERLVRLEAVREDLTTNVSDLQRDLLSARGAAARAESEALYHQEKCERLEASVDRAREENMQIDRARSELQTINADLQNSLSTVHAERTRLEGEKRHIEAKVRLVEAQLSTARAAEGRLLEENRQLRTEIASQGALIESVRRIEASLSAKAESERATLQQEIESLHRKRTTAETNFTINMENAKSRIVELEEINRELQASDNTHQKEALEASKAMLESKAELQTLKASFKTLEAQLLAAKRKLGEADSNEEDTEVQLQSRIDGLEADLGAARSEIAALQERASNYQQLAKTNESALAEIRQATDSYKADSEKELEELKQLLASSQNENISRQKIISELTHDLAGQRGEREKLEQDLQSKISALQAEIQNNEKDVTSAKAMAAVLQNDIVALRAEASSAQKNYERELGLHAQARTELRLAYESADEAVRLQIVAEKNVEVARMEINKLQESWEQEKSASLDASKLTEQALREAREQNKVLHSQLETLNELVEKSQASRIAAAAADGEGDVSDVDSASQKLLTELREVVRFLRSENELLQTQLETARRSSEREKSAATVLRRSLEDSRSKLQELVEQTNATPEGTEAITELEDKIRASEGQVVLLSDSNKLLREEVVHLKTALHSTQEELVALKKAAVPVEDIRRELGSKVASLEAEKVSLQSELESWKGRMTSLVSIFNQIDPEEHRLLQKKVEELKQAIDSHKLWQKTTEEENTRIRNIAKNLKSQRSEMQQKVEAQKLEIEQLISDKASLSNFASAESTAQVEIEQLKLAIGKMESEAKSAKTEIDGANSRIERLRGKLHEFQTVIRDLRAKEASLTEQLAAAQASIASLASQDASTTEPMEEVVTQVVDTAGGKAESVQPKALLERIENRHSNPPSDASEDPVIDDIKMPEVPPEGFKFGPSKCFESGKDETTTSEQTVAAPLRSDATPFLPSTTPIKKSVPKETKVLSSGTGPPPTSLQPSETAKAADTTVAKAETKEVTEPKSISKKSVEAKDPGKVTTTNVPDRTTKGSSLPKSPEEPPQRLSSENKEQAIKEKILEKKRRLETLKALSRKQQATPEKGINQEDTGESQQPAKKAKIEKNVAPSESAPPSRGTAGAKALEVARPPPVVMTEAKAHEIVPPAPGKPETKVNEVVEEAQSIPPPASATENDIAAPKEDESGRFEGVNYLSPIPEDSKVQDIPENEEGEEDAPAPESEEVSLIENEEIVIDEENDDVPIEVEEEVVGGMDESIDVGSMKTDGPFGATTLSFASPFAPSSAFGSSPAPIFGQSSTVFATSAPFGSSTAPLTFGSVTAGSTVFGSTGGTGPFLNMKPPSGNLADAPTFSFGGSSNITLTSPTIPAPIGSIPPFGVFPAFGGGGFGTPSSSMQAQPLFGAAPVLAADAADEEVMLDGEDGEGAMDSQE
jgi:nucleoprotein TPR